MSDNSWNPPEKDFLVRKSFKSGNYSIIDYGVLYAFDNDSSIELTESFNSGFTITLRFIFKNDSEKNDAYSLSTNVDSSTNTIEFSCVNFNNSLGTGTKTPIELGIVDGRKLFICFWVYALGGKKDTRKIEYSIYHKL